MKLKSELLKNLEINKLGTTIMINSKEFSFCYTKADSIVKEEFKGQYRYFGGLQCNFNEGSPEYKYLEGWLCDICENLLEYTN